MCSHCMNSSNVKGKHMTMETLIRAVRFANDHQVKMLIISGGEPTYHPEFKEFMDYVTRHFHGMITVTTHGMYVAEPNGTAWFEQYPQVMFQITNDERYYPKPLPDEAEQLCKPFKNVVICEAIGGEIYPQGRALRYLNVTYKKSKCKGTKCFNLRSISHHVSTYNLTQVIEMLEGAGKFCTPSIKTNGSIAMGESELCPSIGNVLETGPTIYRRILESQCNDCQMLTKLTPLHWNAIGYRKR